MLILISPAKSLDYESPLPTEKFTQPDFLKDSAELIRVVRKLAPDGLEKLMDISPALAELNWQRFLDWHTPFTPANARPAVLAFKGDVYVGMQAEMGTDLANPRGKNLYDFWGGKITEAINDVLAEQKAPVLVNLASNEYFKAVKPKQLTAPVITPQFRDLKNGQYKMISFYAKKARGLMSAYIIRNRITDPELIKGFDSEGYYFSPEQSKGNQWVFLRDTPPAD